MLKDPNSYAANRGQKSSSTKLGNVTDYEEANEIVVSDHHLTALKGNYVLSNLRMQPCTLGGKEEHLRLYSS